MQNFKKLPTILLIVSFYTSLISAQETDIQRSWIAGGSFNFNSQLNDGPISIFSSGLTFINVFGSAEARATSFYIAPYVGKEISRHWTLGLQLQFESERYVSDDVIINPPFADTVDLKRNENQYGVSLFGRYVFNPDQKFKVFLQPYVGFSTGDRVNLQDEVENFRVETTSYGAGASLGVLYELSDRFRITSRMGLIGYTAGTSKEPITGDEDDFNGFSTSLNLSSLFFGFEFKF